MSQFRTRWLLLLIGVLLLGGLVGWYKRSSTATETALFAPVAPGTFRILVTATGELRASQAIPITGPSQAMSIGVFQTKISSLVPEGTVVKAGDVIAELDRAPLATRQNDVTLNLQKAQADFTTARLDSALTLAQAREDIRTAEYTLEEKQLLKEEAQYEAPTIKRQAELDDEAAARALEQAKRNLSIKTQQAVAKMSSVGADLDHQQNDLKTIQDVMASFTVRAPAPGMVIYDRDSDGKEKGVGSQWAPWNPTVATLPDLTHMESDTYINEVDVRKIALGQAVRITLDADPGKQLAGIVTQIANVGEQRPNQDGRVFQVKIKVMTRDTTLRPGMTTANAIEIAAIPHALSVPLEAVVTAGGFSYVYTAHGGHIVKQMLEPGLANDDAIIVRRGLTPADRVLLAVPTDTAGIPMVAIPGLKPSSGMDTGQAAVTPSRAPTTAGTAATSDTGTAP
jgi:multidrug efflux pump subunit AcrA (membrane-fusion protein)